MSSKYRHRNGSAPKDGYSDHKKSPSSKVRQNHMINDGQQYAFKPSPHYNYNDQLENPIFDQRPSYQDFHSVHMNQNEYGHQSRRNATPSKSRDSSRQRRKNRDAYEPEMRSMEINSQTRQSRMPDWMTMNGYNNAVSSQQASGGRQLKPDEFWRPDQFDRSAENDEPFHQRRGSQKRQSNKNSSRSDLNNRDTKARSKSRDRKSNSSRHHNAEREFQSLAFFDLDIDPHHQPPLLTSEPKKNKDRRNGNVPINAFNDNHLLQQGTRGRPDISRQLFHNARYPVNEPRSLNYGAQNAFHGPTNWILGHPVQNYPFAQQQVHQPLSHTKSSKYPQNSANENNNRYKGIQGPSSYGVMSFGQRGGYNSGGTTGSGSSSQDPQKSPASRTSSKISYDSTGPHDERYYVTPDDSTNHIQQGKSPDQNIKYKQKTEKKIEMTVPLNDLVTMNQNNHHEKRKRVKSKAKDNSKSILDANRYLFSTKSNELVSSNNNRSQSGKRTQHSSQTKEPNTSDKYNFRESPAVGRHNADYTNSNISSKHKDLSKSSPHLGNNVVLPQKRNNDQNQREKYQRSCDKIVDKKMNDKEDTESGIDIPEPDYSPILIRRNNLGENISDYNKSGASPSQKNDRLLNGRYSNGSKHASPTVWEYADRYKEHLKEDLVDDDDVKKYPNGIGVENINGTKSMSPTNLQSHSYNLEELKQPLSININPLGRSEEEAILSLEKALNGRTRVKDIVEKIRKETERDRVRQELRRSAFLVSQCQGDESSPTSFNEAFNSRKLPTSGSSEGLSDENKPKKGESDLVIEDLEIYGNPIDDEEDKEEGIDIYKDLINVALEQEKLENMKERRAKLMANEQKRNTSKNNNAPVHENNSRNSSDLSLKNAPSPKLSTKIKRRNNPNSHGSNDSKMDRYDQRRSRPNSAYSRRRDDSLSPERSNLSANSNGIYALSHSQDILSDRKEHHPQSIMRSQPNIPMYINPEISSYPNGNRRYTEDDDNGLLNSSNEENIHSRQSHFFNSLFPSRANRFGYPVYPQRHFGIPTPQASGPVSFAGFTPDVRNQTFYDPDIDAQESGSPSLLTDVGNSAYYSSTSTSLLSSVPKLFKSSPNTKSKKNKKSGKRGFFSFFH